MGRLRRFICRWVGHYYAESFMCIGIVTVRCKRCSGYMFRAPDSRAEIEAKVLEDAFIDPARWYLPSNAKGILWQTKGRSGA